MNFLCWLIGHRWQYHGLPEVRRVCVTCLHHQYFVDKQWRDNK